MINKLILSVSMFSLGVVVTLAVMFVGDRVAESMGFYGAHGKAYSPDGKFRVSEYHSMSEGDQLPYGVYLVVSPAYLPESQSNGFLVYAGYCRPNLVYKWTSNAQLTITCETYAADRPEFIASTAYGKEIIYNSKTVERS